MGYDPMTHQPRTDIFSSLPHLIALANLKELLDHHHQPWEQNATARLQAEVIRLQYPQRLLQPAHQIQASCFLPTSVSSPKSCLCSFMKKKKPCMHELCFFAVRYACMHGSSSCAFMLICIDGSVKITNMVNNMKHAASIFLRPFQRLFTGSNC